VLGEPRSTTVYIDLEAIVGQEGIPTKADGRLQRLPRLDTDPRQPKTDRDNPVTIREAGLKRIIARIDIVEPLQLYALPHWMN